ncbi:MAG: peptidylprolyl isomerase [Pseudomonadota bacterium]
MKNYLISAALVGIMALPASAQDAGPDTVVATVNGETITITHILDIQRQLPPEYQNLDDATLFNGIRQQLIQQRVLAAALETRPDWLDEAIENQTASILAGIKISQLGDTPVSEEAIQAAYDEQFSEFEGAQEFNASHILVETEEEAQSLIEQLEGGAEFAALAQEFSTGPSGPRGGELGWFGQGMMVPPFEAAVMELEVGGVSPPIETQFGWHVVTLNDTRTTEPPSLDDVRADIEGQLASAALQEAMTALTEAAEVDLVEDIDPSVLSTIEIFNE